MNPQADAALFFAEFGEDGMLAGQPVRGYFQAPQQAEHLGYAGASAMQPTFELPSASVPAAGVGLLLVLAGGNWRVADLHRDGTGICTLFLSKA